MAPLPTLCAYGDKCSKDNWNFWKIEKDILLKDRRFIKNAAGKLQKALYSNMTANAGVVFKFLVHNVVPKSHTSDTTMKIVPLIWSIIKGMEVDIARLISNEMKSVTLNCALRAKGIKIPTPADEEIQHPINDTFISSLVKREERTTNYQGSSDDGKTTGASSFDLSDFQSFTDEQQRHNQYVRDQNTYIMHQNEATYRSKNLACCLFLTNMLWMNFFCLLLLVSLKKKNAHEHQSRSARTSQMLSKQSGVW